MNNNIRLPKDVIDVITSEKWSSFDTGILSELFPFLDFPMVTLTDLDEIYKIHREPFVLDEAFWNAKSGAIQNSEVHLPYLDTDKSVFVMLSKYPGEDLGVALDFRESLFLPRVIGSDFSENHSLCKWRVMANTFHEFCKTIGLENNYNFVISSPLISHFEWGEITIDGQDSYKDVKCFPNGVRRWDWNETGTQHIPGIQISDVEELLENGAEVLVLSKGFHERLQMHPNTEEYLNEKCIPFYNLQTEEAIKRYNELRKTMKVGGLFHSTC